MPSGKREGLVIVRDITDQRRLEMEILSVSERERRTIGYELHDDLGQWLTSLALRIKDCAKKANKSCRESGHGKAKKASIDLGEKSCFYTCTGGLEGIIVCAD